MSWPVRSQGYSYQVCTNCGIKRLFDEKAFRSYGPYSYELERLIEWERAHRQKARQDVA
jgi:DNA-directed RNA polymerase subunit RPC12/RpoP